MAATFALVVPGRPIDTNFQQVETNKFLITIPNADTANHVVLFMTGVVALPHGTAGCIFFSLPDPNSPPTWHYLGYLTNEKPSAIYKLTNLTQSKLRNGLEVNPTNQQFANGLAFNYAQGPVVNVAQIGISIETLDSVAQMVPATVATASTKTSFEEFINKTVSNLFNYCSSFSRPASELMGNPFQANNQVATNTHYVPLSAIQNWYETYKRRLSHDQNFWKALV